MKPTKESMLKLLNEFEESGAGFWSRGSHDVISVWVRGAHGNDPVQWPNARLMEDALCKLGLVPNGIKPDPMSGHLLIQFKDRFAKRGSK